MVTKDASAKVYENKDETATRHGAWWGIAAGAAVGVLFAPAAVGAAAVGAVSGHLAKSRSRSHAKELGDSSTPAKQALSSLGKARSKTPSSRP